MNNEETATDGSPSPGSNPEDHVVSASAPTPALFRAGRPMSRSCYACNQKKIRCDKKEPCSSCRRAHKPCVYPPVGPRVRRTRNTIISDMAGRIASLEKSLAEARAREAPSQTSSETESSTPSPALLASANRPSDVPERFQEEVLLQKGSSSQYFNDILFSRAIEEEHDIRSTLTSPRSELAWQPASGIFNPMGILSSPSSSIDPASLIPSEDLAAKLWNMYISNVEGWTSLKMSHVPTDEITVYSVINDPSKASYEDLALNFAIYFSAAVAVGMKQSDQILGQNRYSLLLRLKKGLEQSFARGDFLGQPTINFLRALAIYLSALRIHNRCKGIWILNGLAVRTAQSLGLHRDGEHFGLSPFQAEIRRRLWWHLLYREGRAAEDYGLENSACRQLLISDVRLPLNIDDTDIYPEMQQLPNEKQGWTAMTLSLININLAKSMQMLASVVTASSPSSPPSEERRAHLIEEARARMEKQLESCNPVIPRQRITCNCSRFMLRKLTFTTKIQWSVLQRPGPHADFITEENLLEALEILEEKLNTDDSFLKQFSWHNKAFPQYHVTMYVLLHLCIKPDGPSIARAWAAVEAMIAVELEDEPSTVFGSKYAVLAALKAKATAIRERMPRQEPGENKENGEQNIEPASIDGSAERRDHALYQFGDGDSWNFGAADHEWPPWETFAQRFQLDSPDAYWS
ncbi:hypothetical protein GQ53DRAFT_750931 [Thozetella sp. PMI_491]|nr:hypothetical protein GQ53DRAFT_750931 [Thozetella sp. PMI_491]